jgi:hypothetical protein
MRFTLLATLLLLGATPMLAGAQGPAPLGIPAQRSVARIDSRTLLPSGGALEGTRRASPAAKGALIGGLIGLGIGVLAVASADSDSGDSQVVLVVPAMAVIGAGIGAIVGAITGRR